MSIVGRRRRLGDFEGEGGATALSAPMRKRRRGLRSTLQRAGGLGYRYKFRACSVPSKSEDETGIMAMAYATALAPARRGPLRLLLPLLQYLGSVLQATNLAPAVPPAASPKVKAKKPHHPSVGR